MTIQEAWIRGNNLVATAILALCGFAFAPEMFTEDKELYKLDEQLLFLLGLSAIAWYLKGKNKFSHSIVPVIMIWGGLAIKLMGIGHEFTQSDDVGDDIGACILFLLASLLVTWIYIKSKKLLTEK